MSSEKQELVGLYWIKCPLIFLECIRRGCKARHAFFFAFSTNESEYNTTEIKSSLAVSPHKRDHILLPVFDIPFFLKSKTKIKILITQIELHDTLGERFQFASCHCFDVKSVFHWIHIITGHIFNSTVISHLWLEYLQQKKTITIITVNYKWIAMSIGGKRSQTWSIICLKHKYD